MTVRLANFFNSFLHLYFYSDISQNVLQVAHKLLLCQW